MSTFDLSGFTLSQLKALRPQLEDAIADREKADKKAAIDELKRLAAERGFDLGELLNAPAAMEKKTRRAATVQFRNPSSPDQEWSGRGRKPAWVVAHLNAGGSMEGLRVQ